MKMKQPEEEVVKYIKTRIKEMQISHELPPLSLGETVDVVCLMYANIDVLKDEMRKRK